MCVHVYVHAHAHAPACSDRNAACADSCMSSAFTGFAGLSSVATASQIYKYFVSIWQFTSFCAELRKFQCKNAAGLMVHISWTVAPSHAYA